PRARPLPVEGGEVAVGAVRRARPLDAERADHVAERGRQVQALVRGVKGIVDGDALARHRDAVDADHALVERAVDLHADRRAVLLEHDRTALDASEATPPGA